MFRWMDVVVNWSRCVSNAAGKCFVPVVIASVHLGIFSILENKLIGYADDSTLMAVMLFLGARGHGSRVPEP